MNKTSFLLGFFLIGFFLIFLIIYAIQLINYIKIIESSSYREFNDFNNIKYFKKRIFVNKEKSFNPFNIINKIINVKYINNLQYASFILDIFLAFIFILLPLIHYYNIGKKFEKIIEIIGKIAGFIAYILTFFIIYNFYYKKNNNEKEYIINNSNISSSINNSDYQIKDYKQDNDLFLIKPQNNNVNDKKDNKLDNSINKKYNYAKLKNRKIIESNINIKNRNNLYDKHHFFKSKFYYIIMIIFNICLSIGGFLLYSNSFRSNKKVINRLKKYKKKK